LSSLSTSSSSSSFRWKANCSSCCHRWRVGKLIDEHSFANGTHHLTT
jgi:hypothetical protein